MAFFVAGMLAFWCDIAPHLTKMCLRARACVELSLTFASAQVNQLSGVKEEKILFLMTLGVIQKLELCPLAALGSPIEPTPAHLRVQKFARWSRFVRRRRKRHGCVYFQLMCELNQCATKCRSCMLHDFGAKFRGEITSHLPLRT